MNFCLVTSKNEQCSVQLPFGQFCLMTHNVLIKMEIFVTFSLVLDKVMGFVQVELVWLVYAFCILS
jgi:hypothetical protein